MLFETLQSNLGSDVCSVSKLQWSQCWNSESKLSLKIASEKLSSVNREKLHFMKISILRSQTINFKTKNYIELKKSYTLTKQSLKTFIKKHDPFRLEICQNIYTTELLAKKFYTLKVRKLRLFLLQKKRKCFNITYFSRLFARVSLSVYNFEILTV